MIDIIQLIRIKDWLKNLIIFLPIFFAQMILNINNLIDLIYLFFIFSIASSIIYIINDIFDLKNDKLNLLKISIKPLARGSITILFAYKLLFFLSILLIILLFFYKIIIGHVFIFIFLNLLYNIFFKNIPIIDLVSISFGYVVRLDSGSKLIDVSSSFLIIITIFSLSFFVISMKRYIELNNGIIKHSLTYYNKKYLYILCIFSFIFSIIFYLLFIFFKNPNLFLTVPIAVYFLYRYFYKHINGSILSPIDILIKDWQLITLVGIFFLIMFLQLY